MESEQPTIGAYVDDGGAMVEHRFSNFLYQFRLEEEDEERVVPVHQQQPYYLTKIDEMLQKTHSTLFVNMQHLLQVLLLCLWCPSLICFDRFFSPVCVLCVFKDGP